MPGAMSPRGKGGSNPNLGDPVRQRREDVALLDEFVVQAEEPVKGPRFGDGRGASREGAPLIPLTDGAASSFGSRHTSPVIKGLAQPEGLSRESWRSLEAGKRELPPHRSLGDFAPRVESKDFSLAAADFQARCVNGEMPKPGSYNAREWDGTDYTLEEHIKWFDSLAPEGLMGVARMKLFAEYTTPQIKTRLRSLLSLYASQTWSEFLSVVRESRLDDGEVVVRGSRLDDEQYPELSAEGFEDSVGLLDGEAVRSFEQLVDFTLDFGILALRHHRGNGDGILANRLYLSSLPFGLVEHALLIPITHWAAEDNWTSSMALPPWKWSSKALIQFARPDNDIGALILSGKFPDWVTPHPIAKLGRQATRSKENMSPTARDMLYKGERLAGEARDAWRVARTHGTDSMAYLVAFTTVTVQARPGINFGLPEPLYFLPHQA